MNFTKHIEYKPNKQIWRILITDAQSVVIEKRDMSDKQVYFDSFDLENREEIFTDLQLEEKYWLGIEKIYKGVIYFHLFEKPDMPGHKEIIAYDISKREILWRDEEHSYLFLYDDKVYCFKELFEGRHFFALDFKTGELVEDLNTDAEKVNLIYDKSRHEEDHSAYIFPETIPSKNEKIDSFLTDVKSKLAIVGDVEYNVFKNTLLASYHTKETGNNMTNKFLAVNVDSGKEIFTETLSQNVDSFMVDSFFVYKNFLFLLKGKDEVVIYKIE